MTPRAQPQGVTAAVARVRVHLRRRAALAAMLWGAAGAGTVLALAWWLAGPDGWRQGSAVPLALDLTLVGLASCLGLLLERGGRRWLAEARVARAMEGSVGLEDGAVEGALQLAREVPAGVSISLAALAERGVAGRLDLPDARLAGHLGAQAGLWVRQGSAILALVTPVIVFLLVASPARSLGAWSGLGRPLGLLARPTLVALQIAPGDAEVLRGSPLTITVRAPGRAQVTLRWQGVGDIARTETMATDGTDARFFFQSVNTAIEYSAAVPDGAKSPRFRITPVDPLLLSDIIVELTFPPHTGRAVEEYRGETPPLVIPAGTRVRLEGRATRPLTEARLEREEDGLRVPLEAAGLGFTGSWIPVRGGTYQWRFLDFGGRAAEIAPAPLDLTVVPDSAPAICFAFPAVDAVLPMNLRQALVIEARDDYGVGALELVAYRVTSMGERRAPVVQRIELGSSRAVLARPLMDLRSWGLLSGDTVRYFARAFDNAPTPASAETREYVLRMPDAAELRRAAQQGLEAVTNRLQQLSDRARRAAEEARDREREEGARPEPTSAARAAARRGRTPPADRGQFEDREQVRRALEEQKAMSAQAEQARAELEAIAQAIRESSASDPQLQQDLAELRSLLEEAASPELRERLSQLSEALDSTSRESRQTLEELTDQLQRFREQLEQALAQLRQAAADQDLRATTADARELAQREQALADALHEGGEIELRERQQQTLREDAGELAERLAQLEQRLETLKEFDARMGVQEAQSDAAESQRAMDRTQQALRQPLSQGEQLAPPGQPQDGEPRSGAADNAEQAGAAMEAAAEQLEAAQRNMSAQRRAALQAALVRVGEGALSLARRQAEIGRQMRRSDAEGMKQQLGDEAALVQGLRNLGGLLATQAGGPSPEVMEMASQMVEAAEALGRTIDSMEGAPGSRSAPGAAAEDAVAALNGLALASLAAGQQAGDGSGSSSQVTERLDRLAQQQAQLNTRASQIAPLQLGPQAMAEQSQQLSRTQEEIAGDLQRLAEQPGAQDQALGDLEALAEEAKRLAAQLAGGRLDAETRERQERLFHRLLDAGRSLEQETFSQERESEAPATFGRGAVLPLGPDALGALRYAFPSAEQLQRLSTAERELVLRYFDRLNRAPGAPVGPQSERPR